MSHYVIGDVQGCYDELAALCSKVKFDPQKDKLIFAGISLTEVLNHWKC